jgi:hypothetical protein
MATQPTPNPMADLEAACAQLTYLRQRPLLVLYYPWKSKIREWDLDDVYQALRSSGTVPENKITELDVLLHSTGGSPVGGYRLAQVIRDFASNVTFLVPEHAYSAATLLCFAGNQVRLGHFAGLSPIDITLVYAKKEVELATVDSFMGFAQDARKKIEELLSQFDKHCGTNVDSDLLVAMVEEVGAMEIGKYYRERNLTGRYAQTLLDSYMFAGFLNRDQRRKDVITHFLFGAPAHEFHLDYHLCSDWGVEAVEMPTDESDLAKDVLKELLDLADSQTICKHLSNTERLPYFGWYALAAQTAPVAAQTIQTGVVTI